VPIEVLRLEVKVAHERVPLPFYTLEHRMIITSKLRNLLFCMSHKILLYLRGMNCELVAVFLSALGGTKCGAAKNTSDRRRSPRWVG
jgi:hypothetical protein